MATVTLFKAFVTGMTDYIAKHNANYATIETNLNYILGMLTGASGGDISVPPGLKEIFDRQGLIGVGSYDFNEGVLTGPNYNLTVAAGAYWSGTTFLSRTSSLNLSLAGRATGAWYLYLDASGTPALSDTVKTDTIREFHWDSSTHTVSGKTVFGNVAVLFDGDDYHDMLDSAARSKSFLKVADRLEEIEQLLGTISGFYSEGTHSGLNFYYQAGRVRNDADVHATPAGYVTLTDNATNYVELNPGDGAVSRNTSGFASGRIPLYQVTTAGGAISTVADWRTWALAGTGGGGSGGHTQGTDTGTTATDFIIDADAAGNPAGRSGIEVKNGDDPNAMLKFNRDSGEWEYSTDGGLTWRALGDIKVDLGGQSMAKYVARDDPPLVYSESARGSSSAYEPIDLSGYFTPAPQFGVTAAMLRVFFNDSALGIGVKVLFKKGGSPMSPATAFTVWSDENDAERKPADIILPVGDDYTVEFFVFASGADTANLSVYLLGYFEVVQGVGTQEVSFSRTGLAVAGGAAQTFNLTNFLNRGLAHYLKIEETGGLLTTTYGVEFYEEDNFSTLLYRATYINPATPYEDWLPFWLKDADATRELHLKIINNDTAHAGTFNVSVKAERFA
jgi:hypothetical protein